MKKKIQFAQIMAAIALFAIILSIIGSGIMVIFGSQNANTQQISQEEMNELIQSLTGTNIEVQE